MATHQETTFLELQGPELEAYSFNFRQYCKRIAGMLEREDSADIRNAFSLLQELNTGVASATIEAVGHEFDQVVYPLSGTDISAALAYVSGPNANVVTIDENDAFATEGFDNTEIERIRKTILGRRDKGFVIDDIGNLGLAPYAAELVLMGVNLDSIKVTERKLNGNSAVTTVAYDIPGKGEVTHTSFSGFSLPKDLSSNDQTESFLATELSRSLTGHSQQLFLSKAGLRTGVVPLAPYMNPGSVVFLDSGDFELITFFGERRSLEKKGVTLNSVEGKVAGKLNQLSQYLFQNFRTGFTYGYQGNLSKIGIYEVGNNARVLRRRPGV